jgi:predicted outer membrane repeat protein
MALAWRYPVVLLALLSVLAPIGLCATEVWVDSQIGASGNKPGCGASTTPCGTIGYAVTSQQASSFEIVLVDGRTFSDADDFGLVLTSKNVSFRPSDGTSPTVIDCGGQGRFLTFLNPDLSEQTVFELGLHALTVQNCVSDDGGAVRARGIVNVVITDCNFNNNRATIGGAISVTHRNNPKAKKVANLKLSGFNVLFNNSATRLGGAIFSNYSNVDVTGTRFESNKAGVGGGIYWLSVNQMRIVASSFKSNVATANGADGGSAIFCTSGSSVVVSDVTFDSNVARGQGTLALYFGPSGAIANSTFINNRAEGGGGGILVGSSSRATVTSSTFTNNEGVRGGAIMVSNGAQLTASYVTARSNRAAHGGALFFANAKGSVQNSQLDGNRGEDGGAVYATNECDVAITATSVRNNYAKSDGPGLFCDKSTYTLSSVNFANNTAGVSRTSSREQDVFCDTAESYGYCYIEGDQEWSGHCKLVKDNSPKIPVPKWLTALIIGLAVFVFLLVVVVAFWMYRVRRVKNLTSKGRDDNDGYTMVSGTEYETDESHDTQLFGVISKPNDIHYADDTEDDETTDDDDGLIRNRKSH